MTHAQTYFPYYSPPLSKEILLFHSLLLLAPLHRPPKVVVESQMLSIFIFQPDVHGYIHCCWHKIDPLSHEASFSSSHWLDGRIKKKYPFDRAIIISQLSAPFILLAGPSLPFWLYHYVIMDSIFCPLYIRSSRPYYTYCVRFILRERIIAIFPENTYIYISIYS